MIDCKQEVANAEHETQFLTLNANADGKSVNPFHFIHFFRFFYYLLIRIIIIIIDLHNECIQISIDICDLVQPHAEMLHICLTFSYTHTTCGKCFKWSNYIRAPMSVSTFHQHTVVAFNGRIVKVFTDRITGKWMRTSESEIEKWPASGNGTNEMEEIWLRTILFLFEFFFASETICGVRSARVMWRTSTVYFDCRF